MRGALTRYRVMAYVVGCLLVVLVCIGIPLQVFANDDRLVSVAGVAHGWLYMILIITAVDLGRRVRWPWWRIIIIALAGTIPFITFVAEHYATKDAKPRIAALEAGQQEQANRKAEPTEYSPESVESDAPGSRAAGEGNA
jgi:integral membrane protein